MPCLVPSLISADISEPFSRLTHGSAQSTLPSAACCLSACRDPAIKGGKDLGGSVAVGQDAESETETETEKGETAERSAGRKSKGPAASRGFGGLPPHTAL